MTKLLFAVVLTMMMKLPQWRENNDARNGVAMAAMLKRFGRLTSEHPGQLEVFAFGIPPDRFTNANARDAHMASVIGRHSSAHWQHSWRLFPNMIPEHNGSTTMNKPVQPVPEGYEGVIPYLIVNDAATALDFYRDILGAEELFRMDDDGRVGHAEIRIGGRVLMLADENPEMGFSAPSPENGAAVSLMLYVDDVDAVIRRASEAGATLSREVADQFYGDRSGGIVDPFGHRWHLATHIEDVTPEEMERRASELHG